MYRTHVYYSDGIINSIILIIKTAIKLDFSRSELEIRVYC